MYSLKCIAAFLLLIPSVLAAQEKNLALGKPATANSENPLYPAKNAVDGKVTRNSKWMSADVKPPHILEIDLQKYCNISRVIIRTGIPEAERTSAESQQAAGFWSAKNFKLQYWDDANWTDIPKTEVHENRLTEVIFNFSPMINTFRIRMVCDDGEPISIMEFEVMGTETNTPAPVLNTALEKKTLRVADQNVAIRVDTAADGRTMKYVGYNQGYYMPGSNASGWLEYSGVNSVRVWTTLNSYVPLNAVQVDPALTSVAEFDRRKAELRTAPEKNRFIKWEILQQIYAATEKTTNTNPMILDYVLSELKRLHIDPVIQVGSTDFNDTWANKWQQWQRYYALAYYMAKKGDVTMLAMQNEPNHKNSGPMKLDQWISGMQIVSDALTCAIDDVNKKYGKNLKAKMVGPVTAGNNPEWWAGISKAIRTDYHGKTLDHDLLGIFSTHSYNSPATGYANRVNEIRKIIKENHPAGKPLPIVYTEIGRWMNAYLIDKDETMDSPSLFTEWAGIYSNNTRNGAYGMWAFKFSNTNSDVYSQGVKSGHHFTWQGKRIIEDAYTNLLLNKPVSTYNRSLAGMVTDGLKTDISTWTSDSSSVEKWIAIDLGETKTIGSAVVYSGSAGGVYTAPDRVRNYKLQYWDNNAWKDIQGTVEKDNKYAQLFRQFTTLVTTDKVRFVSTDPGIIKLREIKMFAANDGPVNDVPNYDISGIQRAGEVVRLFAKGFKEERKLLKTTPDVLDENLDGLTSFDPKTGNYYMWLVQRGKYADHLKIDLSALPVSASTPVTAEMVGPSVYGEATNLYTLPRSKMLSVILPAQTVCLLTIPSGGLTQQTIKATDDATVKGGKFSGQNYGAQQDLDVALDASYPQNNQAGYIKFNLEGIKMNAAQRIVLDLGGYATSDTATMRFHVYGLPDAAWNEKTITWNDAALLDKKEALILEVGRKAFVAGELVMDHAIKRHYLDVTALVKDHALKSVTFVLVRETRQMGDDEDKGKEVRIGSKEGTNGPMLRVWSNR